VTFAEVIVDHATGKIGKVVPIKDGEDLVAARNQSKAIALAKRTLETATAQAVKTNQGYRAVSAMRRRGTMVVTREELPPVRLVTDRVTEARGPSSEWTYAISRAPSGIDLTITERGTIPSTTQRFISQFTSGHAGPIERYLTQLAAYFDEPPRLR
jgi:hypothetical protein